MTSCLKKSFLSVLVACFFISPVAFADKFSSDASYTICFTPEGKCATSIVNEIDKATRSIHVLAYTFTSKPIARALIEAKNRGVDVKIILDKTQASREKYSSSTHLNKAGIPIWIDYMPASSHNKVMIIDSKTTITGSFNFTKAAQNKNAENVLIIHDPALAKTYTANWQKRLADSMELKKFQLKEAE